jgi:hypothetical protein
MTVTLFAAASPDGKLQNVASRLTEEMHSRRMENKFPSGKSSQPPAATGTSKGGAARTGDTRMLSRGQGSLAEKLEPIKVQLWDAVSAANQVN